jgi:hypothetical protein
MKKEDLKKIIFEEAVYVKNLIEEKKKIENKLKKIEDGASCDESEIEETTGKGQGVNRRASHKGDVGKKLKKEGEIDEISGVSQTASRQAGKNTTNPVYKKRKEKGQIKEEKIVRTFVKNMLYETYQINEKLEVSEYIVTVKHDEGKKKIRTSASSEDAAKKKIMSAEGCPESAIVSIKKA